MVKSRTPFSGLTRSAGDFRIVLLDIALLAIGLVVPIATFFDLAVVLDGHGLTAGCCGGVWFEPLACVAATTLALIALSWRARKPAIAIGAAGGAILGLLQIWLIRIALDRL